MKSIINLRKLYEEIIDSIDFLETKIDRYKFPLSRADFDYERNKKSVDKSFQDFISQQFAAINANKFETFFELKNENLQK